MEQGALVDIDFQEGMGAEVEDSPLVEGSWNHKQGLDVGILPEEQWVDKTF